MESPPTFQHTKALLQYLLVAHPKSRSSHQSSRATVPASLLLSVQSLALESSNGGTPIDTSDVDDETDEEGDRRSSSTAPSSAASSTEVPTDEEQMDSVIDLLEDEGVDEEDKPDALKSLLSSILGQSDPELNLDPLILALLHRHREDRHPSSTPLPPLPSHGSTTPNRPSVSRSSSFRRAFPPGTPLGMSAVRATPPSNGHALGSSVSSTSSHSAPTSPFRAASPSIHSARQTPSHSPWSSPRPTPLTLTLNAGAVEFKFSAGASEFRPGGPGSATASGASSPARSRSPNPTNAHAAQAQWAATSSPLGTPRLGATGTTSHSALSSPSYFPRHLEAGVFHQQNKGKIPRLPWADATESGGESMGGDDDDEEDDPEPREEYAYVHTAEHDRDDWSDLQRQQQGFHPFPPGDEYTPAPGAWDPFESHEYGEGENGGGEGGYGTPDGYGTPTMQQGEYALDGGLGGMGAYSMTPFDVLHSIFAGSDVSPAVLEEALVMSGWDVDRAIEYIIDTQPGGGFGGGGHEGGGEYHMASHPGTPTSQLPPQVRTAIASGSRPLVVSRDSFDGYVGGNGGRGSPSGGPRWQPRPSTPNSDAGRGVGGRVCRYYLSGNCLRSDCKFSHDVGKAVCKFWLRGHCLKGDGRCDFLHSIPPIMRADFEQRARHRSASNIPPPEDDLPQDAGPDLDFPSLGEAPRSRRAGGRNVVDPTRTRFSGAVKFGQKAAPPPPPPVRNIAQAPIRDALPQPRYSARINLRPPALLPTLPTGAALSALYLRYRSSFLELGANRNKCLARAAECWKRSDGAGARKWSREAQDWNRQVAIEGRDSANRIIEERKKLIKDALNAHDGRSGSTDDAPDRRARGHERGGGVCLGVVSQAVLSRAERTLTVEERTEVALDLHGLHADEAVASLGAFLGALEHERFAGLAFVVIGQARHSGQTDPDRGAAAGKLRLEQACSEFLSNQGWPWQMFHGILTVDTLR